MSNPLVSVIVATYNGEKYLRQQLQSLVDQTYPNLEIIVVDDQSSDKSVLIAKEFSKSDSRIRVYENANNVGLINNFLTGALWANGDYVCFCDQDDVWELSKIQVLKNLMEKNPSNALVYSDLKVCDADMNVTHPSYFNLNRMPFWNGFVGEKALLKNVSPGCSMMFKKNVCQLLAKLRNDEVFQQFNEAKRLDDRPFLHDHLAFALAALLGRIDFVKESLVKYRQHSINEIGAFYSAENANGHFENILAKKIAIFNTSPVLKPLTKLDSIGLFLHGYQSGDPLKRIQYLSYYLFLRNTSFVSGFLRATDCFFPKFYRGLKQWIKK